MERDGRRKEGGGGGVSGDEVRERLGNERENEHCRQVMSAVVCSKNSMVCSSSSTAAGEGRLIKRTKRKISGTADIYI